LKILIRAVGRLRDRRMEELCQEYLDRARRHLPVEVNEVADDEGLLAKLPPGAEIIALEPGGDSWNTAQLTAHVRNSMVEGKRAIAFLIGAADGLAPEVVQAAHRRLSLSPLTLPHRLARVILCEQVYRALSIIRGEPYGR
jgi:23S rRNA (pseudouridine1915-N3)-methyltransferase